MIRKSNNQLRNVCAVPAAGVPDGDGENCFTPSIYTVSDRRVRTGIGQPIPEVTADFYIINLLMDVPVTIVLLFSTLFHRGY